MIPVAVKKASMRVLLVGVFIAIPLLIDITLTNNWHLFEMGLRPLHLRLLIEANLPAWLKLISIAFFYGFGSVFIYRFLTSNLGKAQKKRRVMFWAIMVTTALTAAYFAYQIIFFSYSMWHVVSKRAVLFYSAIILAWLVGMWWYWVRLAASGVTRLTRPLAFLITVGFMTLAFPVVSAPTWAWDWGGPIPEPFPFGPLLPERSQHKTSMPPNQALQRTRTASAPSSWSHTGSTTLPASAEGKRWVAPV